VADVQLQDHLATLLADIAQALVVLEAAASEPSDIMRDGTAIQRMIAERHGAQRCRLGWEEEDVRREFQLVREHVEQVVRAGASGDTHLAADAVAVLDQLIGHAEHVSLVGLRNAQGAAAL
jgi:predicted RNA-binding Zn ribbon-like protein